MKNILLLEDDLRVALALTVRLKSSGYHVIHVPDPGFGILFAASNPPDLIISDIWMPVMQGFSFVRKLPQYGLPNIPVIFITAARTNGLWETAMELGAAGYFEKPYDPKRLLATVAKSLSLPATLKTEPSSLQPRNS